MQRDYISAFAEARSVVLDCNHNRPTEGRVVGNSIFVISWLRRLRRID